MSPYSIAGYNNDLDITTSELLGLVVFSFNGIYCYTQHPGILPYAPEQLSRVVPFRLRRCS